MRIPVLLGALITIISCSENNSEHENDYSFSESNPLLINLNSSFSQKAISSSDLIRDVKVVKFQLPDSLIMGGVDKLLYHSNKIIVMDNLTSSVYVFNETGHLLFRIYKQGMGPGEYQGIDDISIDTNKNSLQVLDLRRNQIVEYSVETGSYLDYSRYSFFTVNMAQLTNNSRIFYNAHLPNGMVDTIDVPSSSIFITNNQNGLEKTLFPLKDGLDDMPFITRFGIFPNYSVAGGINYIPLYDNKVFHFLNDEVNLAYEVIADYKFANEENLINYSGGMQNWIDYLDEHQLAHGFTNFLETDSHITFEHVFRERRILSIFDKKSGNCFSYNLQDFNDDLGIGPVMPKGIIDGYFATVLNQSYFNRKNMMVSRTKNKDKDWRRVYLSDHVTDKMTEDELLVLVKFKNLQ